MSLHFRTNCMFMFIRKNITETYNIVMMLFQRHCLDSVDIKNTIASKD